MPLEQLLGSLLRASIILAFLWLPTSLVGLDFTVLSDQEVCETCSRVLDVHISRKVISPSFVKNILINYFDDLDEEKRFFLKSEVDSWLSSEKVAEVTKSVIDGRYDDFVAILQTFTKAVARHRALVARRDGALCLSPEARSLLQRQWARDEGELFQKLVANRLELKVSPEHLPEQSHLATLKRANTRKATCENQILQLSPSDQSYLARTLFLKALGSSLDAHTSYLTAFQLEQLATCIQQRFTGVGLHLCEQVGGFSVLKLIAGSPADRCQALSLGDLITEIDGEPIAGLSHAQVSKLIRGPEGTQTLLTVERRGQSTGASPFVPLIRERILVREGRLETLRHPFGEESIGVVKLNSFYEDDETSAAEDLAAALRQLQGPDASGSLAALVLDLRENSGGLLPQAVEVVGLFLKRGVVVSIKDSDGKVHHVRNFSATPCYRGPLIVLTSRASASASEIVAQSLRDYGRAVLVGDDRTYGKGTFQTLCLSHKEINPKGDFKVTRGRYYGPSGRSPQKIGVEADILVPGPLSASPIGEVFAKNCIDTDRIPPTFHFPLDDLPLAKRESVRRHFGAHLQGKEEIYSAYIPLLRKNSEQRMLASKPYQRYLAHLQSARGTSPPQEGLDCGEHIDSPCELVDLQLHETLNIARDLILVHRLRSAIAQR